MRTEHRDQASICPFALREVSVLAELALGHLRYSLTDVPPQPNYPPDSVLESDRAGAYVGVRRREATTRIPTGRRANPGGERSTGRGHARLRAPRATLNAWLENSVTTAARSGRRTRPASPSK